MTLRFQRKTMTKNLSLLVPTAKDEVDPRDIDDLRNAVKELIQAVEELQLLQVHSRKTDTDGNPENGAMSEFLRGEYVHLTQTDVSPNLIAVRHNLGRVPQGAIFIRQTGICRAIIEGSITLNVPPASATEITFELNGSTDDLHICILI